MNNKRLKRSGSTFIVVIGILAIIIFAASLFMSSTVQEGRQTKMSIRGLHANSLAEAAIERAMTKLSKNINKIDKNDPNPNENMAVTIRLPAAEGSSSLLSYANQSANLGDDQELNLSDAAKREFEFNKDDLKNEDLDDNGSVIGDNDLEELVDFMTDGSCEEYTVNVKAKIVCAFRNSPGSDYKVPGVDIPWNMRRNVKSLLNGDGYSIFELRFPKSMRWFSFSINFLGLIEFDLTQVISDLLAHFGVTDPTLADMTTLDWAAETVLNKVIAAIAKKITGNDTGDIYPLKIDVGKGNVPTTVADLWPNGTNVTEGEGQYLEKYGQINFDCEASIKYKDGYTSTRRINAVKDFKVTDCEPPAPMYSLFISNEDNDEISFNNSGGQFYVNNITYTNMKEKIKQILRGEEEATEEEMNQKEFPGLIRVNASCDDPIICNIGFLGQTLDNGSDNPISIVNKTENGDVIQESASDGLPSFGEKGRQIINGVEVPLLLKSKAAVVRANKSFDIKVKKSEKKPDDAALSEEPVDETHNTEELEANANSLQLGSVDIGLFKKLDLGINLTPAVTKMGCNIVELGICLALMPLAETAADVVDSAIDDSGFGGYVSTGLSGFADSLDCFETWEMPYMGTANSLYTLPDLGRSFNKTHLFGYSGFHPTLTREIEGNVVSQYRQWRMCIVGLGLENKIYIGVIPIPPIPIPIWKTTTQQLKYGYNIPGFMALDDNGNSDSTVHTYSPNEPKNKAPNLYTSEQYAKKSNYYYASAKEFIDDIPNRLAEINGKKTLVLNGVTYIADSLGDSGTPFSPKLVDDSELKTYDTLYVHGKGMIVVSGNLYLGCNIVQRDDPDETQDNTVFSLICRNGGLMFLNQGNYLIEGSLYTDQGIFIYQSSSLHILGNWVTNKFKKDKMGGHIILDYKSTKTRNSIGSLHPERGKYDPNRYHVSFSPIWSTWRAY